MKTSDDISFPSMHIPSHLYGTYEQYAISTIKSNEAHHSAVQLAAKEAVNGTPKLKENIDLDENTDDLFFSKENLLSLTSNHYFNQYPDPFQPPLFQSNLPNTITTTLPSNITTDALRNATLQATLNQSQIITPIKAKNDDEEEDDGDFANTSYVGRYQCPHAGCSKLYKNRNGLKYHLKKGSCRSKTENMMIMGPDGQMILNLTPTHSTPSSPKSRIFKPMMEFINDPETYAKTKPYYCRLCTKRYKNQNGLKYHARVEHPEWDFEDVRGQ
ncbi:hypothetical protein BC833DRAFT_95864 [Globomyces pollinis-pini]|nr:hypothetical protein BC833DRAFT_95864 [Globomyces pollinis-pini]